VQACGKGCVVVHAGDSVCYRRAPAAAWVRAPPMNFAGADTVMSILTKGEILAEIQAGQLRFSPELDTFQIQAHAIDLRLGFSFLIARHWVFNQQGRIALQLDHLAGGASHFDSIELEPGQVCDVLPGESLVVSTLETITMPTHLVGHMYPRSSVNRQGLAVDLSGLIDAGYSGKLIIPVRNNNTSNVVRLYPGERFCQLTLTPLNMAVEPRQSRYHRRDIATGVLPEMSQDEVELVRQGDLTTLKARYGVQHAEPEGERP
jgi:dCTP deaminase